jgi:hypothetical protein
MFDKIRNKIESKRNSKNLLWKIPVNLKDFSWNTLQKSIKYLKENKEIAWNTNKKMIEIEIVSFCNLGCINCNRSCRQAPSNEYMSAKQIKKFVDESIDLKWKWERINILGGEPTLHPELFKILKILKKYKEFYPGSDIKIATNGFGKKVNKVLSQLPSWLNPVNTYKKSNMQRFSSYNLAPIDTKKYKNSDFAKGCWITENCGMGLTRYGYYICGPGASVDRIFGLDIGIKRLSLLKDSELSKQRKELCKYCGIYKDKNHKDRAWINEEKMSPAWIKAYKNYKKEKPKLSLY